MKTRNASRHQASGNVLVITLLSCVILGILMGSYLALIKTQHLSVSRAQAWNAALALAEAGAEEALAHLNSGVSTNNLAVNGWESTADGTWRKTNALTGSHYLATIQMPPAVTNVHPVVTSTGFVPAPISTAMLARTIQVATRPRPLNYLDGALIVMTTVNFNGTSISTDSFNSSDERFSTAGLYDPKKALDHGDVVSLSPNTNAVVINNGKVKGSVHVTEGGTATVGSNGSIGDSAWVNSETVGAQPGHVIDDVNYDPPPGVVLPQANWLGPKPGKYKVGGQTYDYKLDNSSAWKMSELKGKNVYIGSQDVILYVTDEISQSGSAVIYIAPNASLKLYVGAPTATIGGQAVINASGLAKNFFYYGLPTNTRFDLGGNSAFVGNIYAPQADFILSGGGADAYDFIGSALVRSAKLNGNFRFHFDEGLKDVPADNGYVAISWDEL